MLSHLKEIFTNIPLRPVVLFLIWGIERSGEESESGEKLKFLE